jgi:hypothetical protein
MLVPATRSRGTECALAVLRDVPGFREHAGFSVADTEGHLRTFGDDDPLAA